MRRILIVLVILSSLAASQVINPQPGGGGSGTVSANNGSAGAIAFYSAAAGSTTVGPEPNITDSSGALTFTQGTLTLSSPFISHTATWNASGVAFTGFSQNITCTAAATASIAATFGVGGQWQMKYGGANCTNAQLLLANGAQTAPAYSFSNANSTGFFVNAGTRMALAINGTEVAEFRATPLINMESNFILAFCSLTTSCNATAPDTGVSRGAAGEVSLGNGAAQNETSLLRSGMPCRISSAVTLSTSATTICTWSFPAVAQVWSWKCDGTYSITAGTTPTFALGINPSQAPSVMTGSARIASTGSGSTATTPTETFATNSATVAGNLNLLTGASVTTVTNAPFSTYGVITSSATAGTFAITATLGGTTPAGTVAVGTECLLR